jgi:DNA-binding NarL/FixJ family response regulator
MVPASFQAEDGIEGLSAAALYHPDVVLCDLNMPNMDGHEVIACLTARYPQVPVIVISGQDQMAATSVRCGRGQDFHQTGE